MNPKPQGCSMLLDDTYVGQNSIEAKGIVVERFRDIGHAARTEEIEGKATHPGKDAGIVPDAAAVFTEAHITHIVLAMLDAPVPTYRLSIEIGPHSGLAVAGIIGELLGLAPLADRGHEYIACAPHLDDGANQSVPLSGQGGSGKDAHLTPFDALALMVKLSMSAGVSRARAFACLNSLGWLPLT